MKKFTTLLIVLFLITVTAYSALSVSFENEYVKLEVTPDTAYNWYGNFEQSYSIENKQNQEICLNSGFLFDKPIVIQSVKEYELQNYTVEINTKIDGECFDGNISINKACKVDKKENVIKQKEIVVDKNLLYSKIDPILEGVNSDKSDGYYNAICIPPLSSVNGKLNYKSTGFGKFDFALWSKSLGISWVLDPFYNESRYTHDFDNTIDINLTATTLNVNTTNSVIQLGRTGANYSQSRSDYQIYDPMENGTTGYDTTYWEILNVNAGTQETTVVYEGSSSSKIGTAGDDGIRTKNNAFKNQSNFTIELYGRGAVTDNRNPIARVFYGGSNVCDIGDSAGEFDANVWDKVQFEVFMNGTIKAYKDNVFNNACTGSGWDSTSDNFRFKNNDAGTSYIDRFRTWNGTIQDEPKKFNITENYLESSNITNGTFSQVKLIAVDYSPTLTSIKYGFTCDGTSWGNLTNNSYVSCPVNGNRFYFNITLNTTDDSISPKVYSVAYDFIYDSTPSNVYPNITLISPLTLKYNLSNMTSSLFRFNFTGFDEEDHNLNYTIYASTSSTNVTTKEASALFQTIQNKTANISQLSQLTQNYSNGTDLYYQVFVNDSQGGYNQSTVELIRVFTLLQSMATEEQQAPTKFIINGSGEWQVEYLYQWGYTVTGLINETNESHAHQLIGINQTDIIVKNIGSNQVVLNHTFETGRNYTNLTTLQRAPKCDKNMYQINYNVTGLTSTPYSFTCDDTNFDGNCTIQMNVTKYVAHQITNVDFEIPADSLPNWVYRNSIDLQWRNMSAQTLDTAQGSATCSESGTIGVTEEGDGQIPADTSNISTPTNITDGNSTDFLAPLTDESVTVNPTITTNASGIYISRLNVGSNLTQLSVIYSWSFSTGGNVVTSVSDISGAGGGGGGVVEVKIGELKLRPSSIDLPVFKIPLIGKNEKRVTIKPSLKPTECLFQKADIQLTCEIDDKTGFVDIIYTPNKEVFSDLVQNVLIIRSETIQDQINVTFRLFDFTNFDQLLKEIPERFVNFIKSITDKFQNEK